MKRPRLTAFDRKHLSGESIGIIGVDEAGRGALAGPVVAGAVLVRREFYDTPACRRIRPLIRDSKILLPEKREAALAALEKCRIAGGIHYSPGMASVEEIEEHNILGATRLAMKRAIDAVLDEIECPQESWQNFEPDDLFYDEKKALLSRRRPIVLVDGRPLRPFYYPHIGLVQGDGKSFAIAAASIIAKVTRDRVMLESSPQFPSYAFDSNKGYCTPVHIEALQSHGPSPFHREKFLRRLIAENTADDDTIPMFEEKDLQESQAELNPDCSP